MMKCTATNLYTFENIFDENPFFKNNLLYLIEKNIGRMKC